MEKNIKEIQRILEAIESAVDKESGGQWKEEKPKLEKPFNKVKEGGEKEIDSAKANYAKVKETSGKKIETKPAFSSIKDPGTNGGAKSNITPNKTKNPYKESAEKPTIKVDPKLGKIVESENFAAVVSVDLNFFFDQLMDDQRIPEELVQVIVDIARDCDPALMEVSTNMKKITDRNPAINENDAETFEETLKPEIRKEARKLREAIEAMSGKKVLYLKK